MLYSDVISRDMKKRRSSQDSEHEEDAAPETEGETKNVAEESVDTVAETTIVADPAQAEGMKDIDKKEIMECNKEAADFHVDSDVNEMSEINSENSTDNPDESEINGEDDADKPNDNHCVGENIKVGTEERQLESIDSTNVDDLTTDGTRGADEVETAKSDADDGNTANTSVDNVDTHNPNITKSMNGDGAVNVPLADDSAKVDSTGDAKNYVENNVMLSDGQHGTTDAVNGQSKHTVDDPAAASIKDDIKQDIKEEEAVGINEINVPLSNNAIDMGVQSMVGGGDASLSMHEKLIQKECEDWIADKVEPEQSENPSLVVTDENLIPDNRRAIEIKSSYEADDNESFSDDSFKRKTSVDMEDVDLIEDRAFSGSGAKEAFGFLVSALRDKLGDDVNNVPDATLKQYLCWKPDVNRAEERYRAHNKYLKENFNEKTLLLSVHPNVCYLLRNGMALAPEELVDKNGSAVMVIRASKCYLSSTNNCSDTDASRAIFFTIQHMLERKSLDTLIGGIVIVLDLTGCVRKNISNKLIKLLGNASGCFPVRIKAIYVVAMPWWFPSSNKRLLSAKLRERIHILKDKAALSEYIDEDRLLEEDGGIYNFDLQSWISTTLAAEVGY